MKCNWLPEKKLGFRRILWRCQTCNGTAQVNGASHPVDRECRGDAHQRFLDSIKAPRPSKRKRIAL